MKKIYLFTLLFMAQAMVAGVNVQIADGLDNASLQSKMETTMYGLLTEINKAEMEHRNLNFAALVIPEPVKESLTMLWENSPFQCTDDEIVETCLTTNSGYQIRNIPLMMKPRDDTFNESEYQEAVISFDKYGNMESFYLSLNMNLYMNVMRSNNQITDIRRRQLILDYVERFRTAYNTKDIHFLNQVFSDDALIITGKVVKVVKDGVQYPSKITYNKQTKEEYLQKLQQVFKRNSYIKVTFDEIEVSRHPVNPDVYGVTLHQGYTSSNYHDDGYLFLLWDFSDEEAPKIHVRTWQPDSFDGKRFPKEKVFTFADFEDQ